MNEFTEFITKIIVILMLLSIYFFRNKMSACFQKKSTIVQSYFDEITNLCKIKFNNVTTSIILPVVLIIGYWYYLLCWTEYPAVLKVYSTDFLNIINVVLLGPLQEEIIFRGILLGWIIIALSKQAFKKLNWKENKSSHLAINTVSIFIMSLIFSIFHAGSIDLRFIVGILTGIVFLIDGKNLLPALLLHSLNNFITVYVHTCSF